MDSMKKYSKDFRTEDSSLDFKFFASFFFFFFVLFSFWLAPDFQSIRAVCLLNVGANRHTVTFMVCWKDFLASIPGTTNSQLFISIKNKNLYKSRQLLFNKE